MTYPFAAGFSSSHDDLCENSMKFEDRRDNRADLPTKYSTSSGESRGDGVRLFFRLPIMTVLRSRGRGGNGSRSTSPFLYLQPTIWLPLSNRNQRNQSRNLSNKKLSNFWMTSTLSQRLLFQTSRLKRAENSQKRPGTHLRSSPSSTKSLRRAPSLLALPLHSSSAHVLRLQL